MNDAILGYFRAKQGLKLARYMTVKTDLTSTSRLKRKNGISQFMLRAVIVHDGLEQVLCCISYALFLNIWLKTVIPSLENTFIKQVQGNFMNIIKAFYGLVVGAVIIAGILGLVNWLV